MLTPDTFLLTDHDMYLFREGTHARLYDKLGCHLREGGAHFAVWAPNARRVSVIGDFNGWRRRRAPARARAATARGIWEGDVAGVARGQALQVPHRLARRRHWVDKADPFAFYCRSRRPRPPRAPGRSTTNGATRDWMARTRARATRSTRRCRSTRCTSARGAATPTAASSTTARLAHALADYVASDGLHARRADADHRASVLRLVGLPDHRLLRADRALRHAAGLHVPRRHAAPARHRRDPRLGAVALSRPTRTGSRTSTARTCTSTPTRARASIPSGTASIFNYGRHEVRAFLLSSALFWLDHYHIDGLRVDAVASMLYLDYGAQATASGSRTRTAAARTSRRSSSCAQLNEAVYRDHPDVQMIAEESTAWPMVSRPDRTSAASASA